MSYKVTAKAAAQFTTELYTSLTSGEGIDGAVHAARKSLMQENERRGRYGHPVNLEDWLVPVVYKDEALSLSSFVILSGERRNTSVGTRPNFFGRDNDIFAIEMRLTSQPFMLLEGMLGVGKSYLLRYLSEWWRNTGFVKNVVFIDFGEVMKTTGQICKQIVSELSPGIPIHSESQYEVLIYLDYTADSSRKP